VHVERYGHGGAPILLIHGFGTCAFLWREIGPALAMADRTAFAIDLFGYGESDRPFDAAFGIAAQAEYLDQALTALRIPRAAVVGLDLGAAVALRLAASHPERVDKLVLVNPIALDEVPAKDVASVQRNTARFALRISRGVLGAAPLLGELLRKSVAKPEAMPDPLIARYLAPYVGQEGLEHLLRLGRAVDRVDMDEIEYSAIPQPTLVVWGDQDPWASARLPDRISEAIPDSRLVRIPGVGRLVPEEAPQALTKMVLDFLGGRGTL